jgi:chaperone modulatory protein CbpM
MNHYDLVEICLVLETSAETIIAIIDEGIINPNGNKPNEWKFDTLMCQDLKTALRLHQDLELDWNGIALAIQLLNELDSVRQENKQLKYRLQRFISE